MARGRVINRELVGSQEFFQLPYWGELLWVGMVVNASDEGLIRADTGWLRARFLSRGGRLRVPSIHAIDTVLTQYEHHNMLVATQKDGLKYWRINNWALYQPRARARVDGMGDDGMGGEGMDVSPPVSQHKENRRRAPRSARAQRNLDDAKRRVAKRQSAHADDTGADTSGAGT